MRWWWVLAILGCGGERGVAQATQAPAASEQVGERRDVDVPGFASAYDAGEVRVLDVRTPEEYASGHIPGAVHLPIDQLTPDHPVLRSLATDEPVYVVCETGGRSSRAADALAAAGYTAINVDGGTRGWRAAGREVRSED